MIETINPHTENTLSRYEFMAQEEVADILEKAETAFRGWAETPLETRAGKMVRVAAILEERKESLAGLMTQEMRKPIQEAPREVEKCAWACRYYAENGPQFLADVIARPQIAAVTLTGSERAGESVAEAAGKAIKESVLEPGGSDPYLVLAEADLDPASEKCAKSRLINSGQSCIAAKRFLVDSAVHDEFVDKLTEKMVAYELGNPLAEATQIGPLAREDSRESLHDQVTESVGQGAQLKLGGEIPEGSGVGIPRSGWLPRLLLLSFVLLCPAFTLHAQDAFESERMEMVEEQIEERGIDDPDVLRAMRSAERHLFVPEGLRSRAYKDRPLPIGYGQTISQPYIVAFMTEIIEPQSDFTVLEIGAGSGYQSAVLAEIVDQVYTLEIVPELAKSSKENLKQAGYANVTVRAGDGFYGWESEAPFDAIVVTAASPHIPPPLIEQLKEGGRMIIPVGSPFRTQQLVLVEKKDGRITTRSIMPVRFVPFTRAAEDE